jgi:hypothetical protein
VHAEPRLELRGTKAISTFSYCLPFFRGFRFGLTPDAGAVGGVRVKHPCPECEFGFSRLRRQQRRLPAHDAILSSRSGGSSGQSRNLAVSRSHRGGMPDRAVYGRSGPGGTLRGNAARRFDKACAGALARLLPQLSGSARHPAWRSQQRITAAAARRLRRPGSGRVHPAARGSRPPISKRQRRCSRIYHNSKKVGATLRGPPQRAFNPRGGFSEPMRRRDNKRPSRQFDSASRLPRRALS